MKTNVTWPAHQREKPNRVHISGIKNAVTYYSIKEFFTQLGPVEKIKYHKGQAFGFVTFEDPDDALRCVRKKYHCVQGESLTAAWPGKPKA